MKASPTARPPRSLLIAVALIAASMLLVELIATRLFSVLFFYHFSFFAVSLVMTGLALGGLAVSRWRLRDCSAESFARRLSALALVGAVSTAGSALALAWGAAAGEALSIAGVATRALALLPALTAAGAFLAAAFARDERWIGGLYAADLVTAALACLGSIWLMRLLAGPALLLAPALLAAVAAWVLRPGPLQRGTAAAVAIACVAGIGLHLGSDGRFLRLAQPGSVLFERWNEHSRVVAMPAGGGGDQIRFLIDRSAATYMRRLEVPTDDRPVELAPALTRPLRYVGYRLGRELDRVAIIGVGAGEDLGPALAHGARRIDGYELNRILIDAVEKRFVEFNNFALRPEVHLIHGEARVGIAHADRQYDLIQASLIDTWAATASGGFVLAENGLYTLEAWRQFLGSLSKRGILTMTRLLLPGAPAETQRLVSLAAAALETHGVADPFRHVLLAAEPIAKFRDTFTPEEPIFQATILVSPRPYTRAEINEFKRLCRQERWLPLAIPGEIAPDPVVGRLLDPATRMAAIGDSEFDISPPSDQRPYFFLQLRPRDIVGLKGREFGAVTEITFNGIRVLVILATMAAVFTLAVWVLAVRTLPGERPDAGQRRLYRRMTVYFLGIGLGYILVQLSLHQRLILILGHPTLALAVVLFSMLLGTGLGSAVSGHFATPSRMPRAWLGILIVLVLLLSLQPRLGAIEAVPWELARQSLAALIAGGTGFALGFAFPLGVRLVGGAGQWAVQKMWAVNGAASIAGSALAALIGIAAGSFAVLATGLALYLVVAVAGFLGLREAQRAGLGETT